jgi:hypothetical protein
MPSVSLFQYAPVALCIPLRPFDGWVADDDDADLVLLVSGEAVSCPASGDSALDTLLNTFVASDGSGAASASVLVDVEAVVMVWEGDGSTRCWMIVLFTANLYC